MKNRHTIVGNKLIIFAMHKGQRYEIIIDAYHKPKLKGFRFNVRPNREDGRLYVFGGRTVHIHGCRYREEVYLHRLLMNAPDGLQVDHINGDSLNNTDANLRLATSGLNGGNRNVEPRSSTGYRNVYTLPSGKFMVQIGHLGRNVYCGTYDTLFEAAQVAEIERKRLHPFSDPSARMDTVSIAVAM